MNDIPIFSGGGQAQNSPVAPLKQAIETNQSVADITANVAAQYTPNPDAAQPAKKARKPRSDIGVPRGKRGLANNSGQGEAMGLPENSAVGYTIDKQIVEKTATTILHTVDGILVRKVGTTVLRLGGDESLAKELAANSGLTQAECALMAELTGVVFEKHGLLTGYAPEILLGVLLAEWGIRVTLVVKRLTLMENEMKRVKTKEDVSPPSPR